jgi:hypothetical protein
MTSSQGTSPYLFRTIWPVISPEISHTLADLFAEASGDLPQIARRHSAQLTGPARWLLMPGRQLAGSAGAPFIIVSDSAAFIDPTKEV